MLDNSETRFEQPATKEDLDKIGALICRMVWLQNVFIVCVFGVALLILYSRH